MHTSSLAYTGKNKDFKLDHSKNALLSEAGVERMKDTYYLKSFNKDTKQWIDLETSPQEVFSRAAFTYATDQEHGERIYKYISNLWFMPATPILSNAGTTRGLPISCFLGQVDDSRAGIVDHIYENAFLSSYGGGIGGDWSKLRSDGTFTSTGNKSTGLMPFLKMIDAEVAAFMQGSSRRGAYAAYLDVSHPEIEEFIDIRRPTSHSGADVHRRCLGVGFHHAVTLPDAFMEAVQKGESWNLVDPHTKEVLKSVSARDLWMKILLSRVETGEPYLFFKDTANAALNPYLKEAGLTINNSNLCAEIMLPTAPDRTAVCCLSSVNLEFYDDWKDEPLFIQDCVEFLDNVLQSFIDTAPKAMWRAVESARRERSIGLGTMGFHLYLQKKKIPFESPMAIGANKRIFKEIKEKAVAASAYLATVRGEPEDLKGSGMRNAHLMAVAPNASISAICGNTSPSIEPFNSNGYSWTTISGVFLIKNKELDRLLQAKYGKLGAELNEVWSSIITNQGSVQHLDFMDEVDRVLFKTAFELDQNWIIEHAAKRQEYICQGQSVNLFVPPDVHKNDLHKLHFSAWQKGLKSLYYCRSKPIRNVGSRTENTKVLQETVAVKEPAKEDRVGWMEFMSEPSCLSCEG